MNGVMRNIVAAGIFIGVISITVASSAFAHVVVSPKEVESASRTTFSVSVPNEHDTPVVAVRLVVPDGVASVRPFVKAGWDVSVMKSGTGEDAKITEINWIGGAIPVDLKDEFQFGAIAPKESTDLKWKAYETYADGRVVAWDQEPSEAEENKPYSTTKIVSQTATDAAAAKSDQVLADTRASADRSLYIATAGVLTGLVGVFLATRRK